MRLFVLASIATAMSVVFAMPGRVAAQGGLAAIELALEKRYDIPHLRPDEVARFSQQKNTPVALFDVRQAEEYAVSHISGAIRVDPGISEDDFMQQFASVIGDKQLVFYCSVGQRSSELATRMKAKLLTAGAMSVSNLRGGIFRWHGQGRPLRNAAGPTPIIHPYSEKWARLVPQPEQTGYAPVFAR